MPDCEWLKTCPFFQDKMKEMPSTAELSKNRYCRGAFGKCARFKVKMTLGPNRVPSDLFPDMHARADELLAGGKTNK